jgi:hypothetical protein
MRSAYRVLGYLIALGVVVQAAVIAYAWFAVLGELESGSVFDENSEGNVGHALHGMIGMMVLPALSLIFLIVSFFAKVPDGVKWAAITFVLVVLQVVLAFVSFGAAVVGLLHGANAIAIAAVASAAASRVGKTPAAAGVHEHELV